MLIREPHAMPFVPEKSRVSPNAEAAAARSKPMDGRGDLKEATESSE